MDILRSIHVWEIDGYIKLEEKFIDYILKKASENYGSLNKAREQLNLNKYFSNKNNFYNYFKKADILFKFTDAMNISRSEIEQNIISWKDSKRDLPKGGYQIKFPIQINPLFVRIISHLIGDGNINRTSTWMQNNVKPLEKLQIKLFKTGFKERKTRKNTITIPKILLKVFCSLFNIPINKLNKIILLENCLKLPREYKIQVLSALIEDEGTITDYVINIRMRNKELMCLICELIDSLGYDRGSLNESQQLSGFSQIRGSIYSISINISGAHKYIRDLTNLERKYGEEICLWKKKEKLENLLQHKSKIRGWKKNRFLTQQILKNKEFFSFSEIKSQFLLKDNEVMSLIRFMKNQNLINNVSRGEYKIKE